MTSSAKTAVLALFCLILSGCTWNEQHPTLAHYTPSSQPIKTPDKKEHLGSDFEKELFLGKSFALQKDDSLAILHFRRAKILANSKQQAQKAYLYALNSYLSKRDFMEGLRFFSSDPVMLTPLSENSEKAAIWNQMRHDALAIAAQMSLNQIAISPRSYGLYNSIHQTLVNEQNTFLSQRSNKLSQSLLTSVEVSFLLQQGSCPKTALIEQYLNTQNTIQNPAQKLIEHRQLLQEAANFAKKNHYNPGTARLLNALLPGAGYYYVGQKNTALTSFCLNVLFTAAAYRFFDQGDTAAGIIATSLELGWYIGGINGAGMAAIELNEKNWRNFCEERMEKEKVWPIFEVQTQF